MNIKKLAYKLSDGSVYQPDEVIEVHIDGTRFKLRAVKKCFNDCLVTDVVEGPADQVEVFETL